MTQRNPRHTAQRPVVRRTSWVGSHIGLTASIAAIAAVVLAVGLLRVSGVLAGARPADPPVQAQQLRYLGVYEPGAPNSYAGIEQFGQDVGRAPNLVSYYSGWNEKFQKSFAETAASHNATVIVQVDPTNISLAKIAAGKYDPYLISYANAVASFKHPVVISFGHEMNGFWETWGYHHAPAASFVAAWRHVVTVFRQQKASNVTWLWQVNSSSSQTGPVRDWWPGSQYVNWVGVSGYYYVPADTFDNVFAPVVNSVRQFTQDPLLIAETAVGPQAGQTRGIKNLFTGVRLQNYLGLVWFDQHSYGGLYKGENWRLEDSPVALSTFRTALKG